MLDFFWNWLDGVMANWGGWSYIIYVVFLALGVFFLVKFCDIFVDNASVIARKMKISPLIIGLTVVAIGTSCPELAVSVSDSISCIKSGANAEVAFGNVVGSNICNLLLVLGLSALFTPIMVKKSICKREYPFMIGISVLLVIFGLFFGLHSVFKLDDLVVTRWEAAIFVVLIFVYIGFLIYNAKKHPEDADIPEENDLDTNTEAKEEKLWLAIILVIVGALGVVLGGEFVVYGAKSIAVNAATAAGLDATYATKLVGLTIVAVGTSLPELVTSLIAAKKGENELALGNVIGSNVFNIIFVLGIASVINPIATSSQCIVDLGVMMFATLLVFVFALKGKIGKGAGITFVLVYAAYITYAVLRFVNNWPF